MKYTQKNLKKIKRVLQIKKLKTIEQYRKMIQEADQNAPGGVDKNLADSLHIYGNTAKTHIDVFHRSIVKPIESSTDPQDAKSLNPTDAAHLFNQSKALEVPAVGGRKKSRKSLQMQHQMTFGGNHSGVNLNQEEVVEVRLNIKKIEIPQNQSREVV